MEEFTVEAELPSFTRWKNGDGLFGKMEQCNETGLIDKFYFVVEIYLDGDVPENEGYVSIVFAAFGSVEPSLSNVTTFQCTVSVVDTDGESRYPQSFRLDIEKSEEKYAPQILHSFFPIKLERFIRRRVILDSSEELLPEDKLTLRCKVVYFYDSIPGVEEDYELQRLRDIAEKESWFIHEEGSEGHLLNLEKADSPLCTRLREKSEFFDALFQMPSKGEEDGRMPVSNYEYDAFFNMLGYIRFENLNHIETGLEYCEMYEMANKYEVPELQKVCSAYLQQHLTWNLAMYALGVADLCHDAELRSLAFRLVLDNWDRVRKHYAAFTDRFCVKRPMLTRELKCAVKLLNLEEEASSDTLSDLAARQILLNAEELQLSPTWSIFVREMPDLAKVICSLVSDDYKPGGKNKAAAVSYYT